MNEIREKEDREMLGDDAELVQLVGMKLGDEEYAIDVLKIQEIIRTVEITVVPRMESFILGVMNLRGKVIPVIDLRVRFSLDNCDFDKSTRIIVVRFEKQFIGFVVDEVTEVIRIRKSMVEPTPPLVGTIGQEYILGICKYDARLIMLLDIDRVLSDSGDQIESDLRKKMLGSTKVAIPQGSGYQAIVDAAPADVQEAVMEHDDSDDHDDGINIDLPMPDAVPSPVISTIAADNEVKTINIGSDKGVENDIDALIARELAMREAETEELNKKKRDDKQDSPEEILEDALAQSSAIFEREDSSQHIEQNDLDSLIAKELAMREAETEELNKKNRAEKVSDEKKNDLNELSSAADSLAIVADDSVTSNVESTKDTASVKVSIKELKRIADKIISGEESENLNLDIKGEIGELLRLILDTKLKVDEINPFLKTSQEAMPAVTTYLEDVNDTTERATLNLMDASNGMLGFYKDFIDDIRKLKTLTNKESEAEFCLLYDKILGTLSQAEDLGLKILEALEFQDITEQKLRKVIKSIEDMGARIGTIVGFLQVQQPKGSSDKRANKLLEDYGLA